MVDEFLKFIDFAKTEYHAVEKLKEMLDDNDFERLYEDKPFNLSLGKKYYFTRNDSSIIAFTIPNDLSNLEFKITAAHLDSPTFKLKPNPLMTLGGYYALNTEPYGGGIYHTWIDRPLDIAGRVLIKNNNKIESKLFSFDKPVCIIPSLSIHYNREVNKENNLNPQTNLCPILCSNSESLEFNDILKEKLGDVEILGHDLYLAQMDTAKIVGLNNEFISAPKIDNLECSFGLTKALINSKGKNINVLALFNSEEVGSSTVNGANSTMLEDTLNRILISLNIKEEDRYIALNKSFMISADNAHALHPLYQGKYDPTNYAKMNEGIVIKSAANASYTSDGYSLSYFKNICDMAGVNTQFMTNRSDIRGGSTLGAISLTHVSIPSVDIGLAQLAMHSSYELCGAFDLDDLIKVITLYYE